jgi:hypothetical protein
MSVGDLTDEDVEGIRTGKFPDPAVSKVAALAAVFGVPPSYLVDRDKRPTLLDEETLEALTDETAAAILRETLRGQGDLIGAAVPRDPRAPSALPNSPATPEPRKAPRSSGCRATTSRL